MPLPWRRRPRCPPPWRGAVTGCQFWHSLLGSGCNKAVGSTRHGAGGALPLGAAEHPRDGGPFALCRWDPRLGEQNPPHPPASLARLCLTVPGAEEGGLWGCVATLALAQSQLEGVLHPSSSPRCL